ncbi:MAG: type II secretion system F family protein [Sporolactobacillus sp.]
MAVFDYVATDAGGRRRKGRLTAASRQEALSQIVKQGLVIEAVKEHQETLWNKNLSLSSGVSLKEKVVFLRQFATIIKAGVPVAEALDIMHDQEEKNKTFKAVLRRMADDLKGGMTLSRAFERHPKVFGSMIVHMVRAGEEGGRLEESLSHLAEYYENQNKSRQKMTTAMIYPLFIVVMTLAVTLFLLTWIVPMFESMFKSMHGKLPGITRFVIALSQGIQHGWPLLLVGLLTLIVIGVFLFRNQSSKKVLDSAILKVPIAGSIVFKSELSRLLWMLALLIASSVPIIDALRSIRKITNNLTLRVSIDRVTESLDFGKSLSQAFRDQPIFPPIIYHMTEIGERTGMLDQMLNHIAEYYNDDVEQALERMKSLMEPVVILLLAVIVGFVVMSVIVPMFQLYQQF